MPDYAFLKSDFDCCPLNIDNNKQPKSKGPRLIWALLGPIFMSFRNCIFSLLIKDKGRTSIIIQFFDFLTILYNSACQVATLFS